MRPAPAWGAGVGLGEERSLEEWQKEALLAWGLYARTEANLPWAQQIEDLRWRVDTVPRRKIQLEEQTQAQPPTTTSTHTTS